MTHRRWPQFVTKRAQYAAHNPKFEKIGLFRHPRWWHLKRLKDQSHGWRWPPLSKKTQPPHQLELYGSCQIPTRPVQCFRKNYGRIQRIYITFHISQHRIIVHIRLSTRPDIFTMCRLCSLESTHLGMGPFCSWFTDFDIKWFKTWRLRSNPHARLGDNQACQVYTPPLAFYNTKPFLHVRHGKLA